MLEKLLYKLEYIIDDNSWYDREKGWRFTTKGRIVYTIYWFIVKRLLPIYKKNCFRHFKNRKKE